MEVKKTKAADLEGRRTTWFLLALVFVLSAIFVTFEYTKHDSSANVKPEELDKLSRDVELIPLTRQQNGMVALLPPKPRTKASPDKIKVVDNTVATQQSVQLPEGTKEQEGVGGQAGPEAKPGEADQTQALSPVATDMKDNPLNFHIVEELPQFPGGAVELMKWLTRNLRYPYTAQQQKVQGKVVVQFIINKDGSVSDIKVVKSLNTDCDREALRVIRLMPKWKPGVQHDKPCRTMVCIPINFKL